ncbi:hypothetical protein [Actinomadura kijaniata]|uniref:hypothetical protein n=1 Tax=Actinomadura kijaniata TaxID=46161 RepID=UPI0012F9F938|nr:hypothetical protein [Actinomadura kijaniata]
MVPGSRLILSRPASDALPAESERAEKVDEGVNARRRFARLVGVGVKRGSDT